MPSNGESVEDPPDTTVPCRIPAGTQSGSVFQIKGAGVPRLDGRGRGSLVAVVQVDVPTQLSDRARALLAELDTELRAGPEPGKRAAGAK